MNEVPPRPKSVRANHSAVQKVEAPSTPTQEVVRAANRSPVVVTDELGRSLKVKYLGIMDKMRITRVLGAELTKNDTYSALASLAFCIVELNGETVAPPVSVREVEVLVERVGEEGARAINKVYLDQGWAKAETEDTDIDTAKN